MILYRPDTNLHISVISDSSTYIDTAFLPEIIESTQGTNIAPQSADEVNVDVLEYLGAEESVKIISSTGLTPLPDDFRKEKILDYYQEYRFGNGRHLTDTDSDGLENFKEIDFRSDLIDFTQGADFLPTVQDCFDHLNKTGKYTYVVDGYDDFWDSQNEIEKRKVFGPISAKVIMSVRILPINSDPTSEDGDEDGYSDFDEIRKHSSNPLVCDVVEYSLKNDFIEITDAPKNKVNSGYGGNQAWFIGDGNKTNYQLVNGGCGVIASADALLYLHKYHNNATINVNIDGETISWLEYESFVRNYSEIYLTPFDLLMFTDIDTAEEISELSEDDIYVKISKGALTWGTIFPKVVSAVNNFNTVRNGSYRLALQDTFYSKKQFEQIIINSLNKDMPILLSYGVSSIPLSIKVIEGADAGKNIKSMHMMNIVGMKTDNITKDTKLIVVSWSRIIEIDLDEYYSNRGYFGGIACFY